MISAKHKPNTMTSAGYDQLILAQRFFPIAVADYISSALPTVYDIDGESPPMVLTGVDEPFKVGLSSRAHTDRTGC
jgi:hypothetical protein